MRCADMRRCQTKKAKHVTEALEFFKETAGGEFYGAGAGAELYLQDGDGLREVVLLHGGGGVQGGQRMVELLQVRVAVPSVVQVMAQAGYQQTLLL